MNQSDRLALLRQVSLLSALDEATLAEAAARARLRRFAAGRRIVSELEFGADVYVMARGQAGVSVQSSAGTSQSLGTIGPGATFGEMAALTGELRSATVTALTEVDVLIISDRDFDKLRARRPEIALTLVRTLAGRLAEAESNFRVLLDKNVPPPSTGAGPTATSSARMLWRQLVVGHQKDLAFLALAAFVAALLAVRAAVFLSFKFEWAPRNVLRAAYVSGFALLVLSGCAALLTYQPRWRRAVAVAFSVGAALILNELGVTLAFDIFYKDIYTPDPSLPFDIEQLYRRTEPIRAIVVGLVVLVQAAYLRRFYARLWFVGKTRVQRWLRLGG
jgi:CRP-like cAMP-binding protein